MKQVVRSLLSLAPFLIIGGLLYAALFVKPSVDGASVAPPAMSNSDLVYGVTVAERSKIFAVGNDGKIWRTDDEKTWKLESSPTKETLQDVAAWDGQKAVAVGNQGIVLRTGDGGNVWTAVTVPKSSIANKLIRVHVYSGGEAWAVGEGSTVLHSVDFGSSWNRVLPEEDLTWNDIAVVNSHAILVGEFGRMRHSENGGETWSEIKSPVKSSLMAVAFSDDNHGVIVGLEGVVLTTKDGGALWEALPRPTPNHLFDVLWDGSSWLATGANGVFARADSSAADWKTALLPGTSRAWHTRIAKLDSGYVAVGQSVDFFAGLPK